MERVSEIIDAAVERERRAEVAGVSPPSAPLKGILLEKGCPAVFRGAASEPRDALNTLREVARLENFDADVMSRQTTMNALALFGIRKHPSAEVLEG